MSLIKVVAELLDLKLYEVFKIKNINGLFRFTENSMQVSYGSDEDSKADWANCSMEKYRDLVLGNFEIEKIKKVPEIGETYYIVFWDTSGVDVANRIWEGSAADYAYFLTDNYFQSVVAADYMKEKIYERTTGLPFPEDEE